MAQERGEAIQYKLADAARRCMRDTPVDKIGRAHV